MTHLKRREWLRHIATGGVVGGLLSTTGSPSANASSADDPTHRRIIRAGQLEALIVDNHDGLGGNEQKSRRDAIPAAAGVKGELFCTVPFKDRFNGYNGVAQLTYAKSRSPFVPCCSGVNCEFVFNEDEPSYEPRWSNMDNYEAQTSRIESVSPSSAKMVIEPARRWGVRVETVFNVVEPYYFDVHHSFTPTVSSNLTRYLGIFWANYIQVPETLGFRFLGRASHQDKMGWIDMSEACGFRGTGVIAPEGGRVANLAAGGEKHWTFGVVDTRYSQPFFCGKVDNQLLAMMFKPSDDLELRFAFSSKGGGPGAPAWDYQVIVPEPKAGRTYSLAARMVYKPFDSLEEAANLYKAWR
jgi:hypothetical protein